MAWLYYCLQAIDNKISRTAHCQVRDAACKLLTSVVSTRPDMVRTMYAAFPLGDDDVEDASLAHYSHARQLIARFKVREDMQRP